MYEPVLDEVALHLNQFCTLAKLEFSFASCKTEVLQSASFATVVGDGVFKNKNEVLQSASFATIGDVVFKNKKQKSSFAFVFA